MNYLLDEDDDNDNRMPREEREWMINGGRNFVHSDRLVPLNYQFAKKSAQCNVRSGVEMSGDAVFGGADDMQK